MVFLTHGPGRWDPTCYKSSSSAPHFAVGSDPHSAERSFASGNERTVADYSSGGQKTGFHVREADDFRLITDFMNMNMEAQTVYLTMTFDFIDGPLASGWRDLKPILLDEDSCGVRDNSPPQETGSFTLMTNPWTPEFEGEVIGIGTHLHDGGAGVKVVVNNSTVVCKTTALYAETPEFVFETKKDMAGNTEVAEKHISSLAPCYYDDIKVKTINKSQTWRLLGDYDYSIHKGNKESGKQGGVMVVGIIYVTKPAEGFPKPFH
jgi:hypothetical protein